MKAVLIPIKEPARVKTRLARLLTLEERQRLVWAMFEDVCRAVADAEKPDAVFLVTSFDKAIEKARRFGFETIVESEQLSESASVDFASRVLRERGYSAVLRLPADIPLVQGEDVDVLLDVDLTPPAAILVPSLEGTGTNALLRTPPDLFPSRFGPNSLALHREAAARLGVAPLVMENPRMALDLDEPQDIRRFLSEPRQTATLALLNEIGIEEKLAGFSIETDLLP